MDVITKSAEYLDKLYVKVVNPQSSQGLALIINLKTSLFNASTAVVVSAVACAIFGGNLSTLAALVVAGAFLFVRKVVEESYNVEVPSLVKYFCPNILKPESISIGGIVICYRYVSPSYLDI